MRNPAQVASSLKRQINREEYLTELQWLQRTVDALHHTAADCSIVHYEDWFTRPVEQAQGLLQYTGLDEDFTGNVEDALKDVIKPNLNRAVYEDYEVKNEYVLKLYDVLKDCRGHDFDRQKLMSVVKECRKAMDGFKGWYMEAQNQIAQKAQLQKKLGQSKGQGKDKQEKSLHEAVVQNNEYLKQIKDLSDKKEELRVRMSSAQHELAELKKHHKSTPDEFPGQRHNAVDKKGSVQGTEQKWRKEAYELRHSTPFRLGNVIVLAINKPGKNTLLMPFRFVKIIGEVAMKKIRLKRSRARAKHE